MEMRPLIDMGNERDRQERKWGVQHHPDGTSSRWMWQADQARNATEYAAKYGTLTWRHIVREEYCEAMAEEDEAKLRSELVQLGACCAAWIEDIDSRADAGDETATVAAST